MSLTNIRLRAATSLLPALFGVVLAAVPAAARSPTGQPGIGASQSPADRAFAELSTLVGIWRVADKPESKLRIRFSLTAGGATLVEEWMRGTEPHSLTLYHRDGERLVATHYCPQGNQPRLIWKSGGNRLAFAFLDATDLDAGESHLAELSFDIGNPAKVVRSEVYRTGIEGSRSTLVLLRQ